MPSPIDDRLLRAIGIPMFGLAIPHVTGLFGVHRPSAPVYWFGVVWFVFLAWMIWHMNRWLLFKQRERVDWFGGPFHKISLLLLGIVFGTVPVTMGMLILWFHIADFSSVDWRAVEVVTLTNTICVIFVTHVYETAFLIRERESDLVRLERAERARAEAELEALRAQIDPHFLFNSLNTLASLIEGDPARAMAFNERLARVYRYILSSRGRPLVLLREELEFVDDYITLLEIRFGDSFRVLRDLGDEVNDRHMLPPLALQLLIENAVKHNEVSTRVPLEVRLVRQEKSMLVINSRRPRRGVLTSPGVGLRNLAERYRVVAQANIGIMEDSESFSVQLPLVPA